MQYPPFLKPNDTIGVSAPSAGVGRKLESFDHSLTVLKRLWRIKETGSVRVNAVRSADAGTRAEEFCSLFPDPEVSAVMCAAGGDFLYEILPYIDWNTITAHPKWIMGASDPTSLLFTATVKYDIATLYGHNAGSFDMIPFHRSLEDCLQILQGNLITQISNDLISSDPPFSDGPLHFDQPSRWNGPEELHVSGRCIGGCIDVLKDLIGTPYAAVDTFLDRYPDERTIWYFDDFALSAETFYLTLLQMKYAGWFRNTAAVIIGRVILPSSNTGMTYAEAADLALQDIPHYTEADIGHTPGAMTMINGAVMNLDVFQGKAHISFELRS
ncbi:MAG: LD-carboxypeptidase [Solobacterium sp.]|nr:LD-carboxypeptidase [Solobacterium sp.]